MNGNQFPVYVNEQYVGKKMMVKNQGQDLLEMDEFLKSNGIQGYTLENNANEIRIRVEDRQQEQSLRSQVENYLSRQQYR